MSDLIIKCKVCNVKIVVENKKGFKNYIAAKQRLKEIVDNDMKDVT